VLSATSVSTTGDFNGDGFPDLVVATNGSVSFFANRGYGVLAAAEGSADGFGLYTPPTFTIAGPDLPTAVLSVDLNGDGLADTVVTASSSASVTVFLSTAIGPTAGAQYAVIGLPLAVEAHDMNGDGVVDLAVISSSSTVILPGLGNGAFGPAYAVGPGGSWLALGDLNGDSRPDVVTGGAVSFDISISLSLPDGGLATSTTFTTPLNSPGGGAIADFDGDGKEDLVVVSAGLAQAASPGTCVFLNEGDGGFRQAVCNWLYGQTAVRVADFNGDGVADIVTFHSDDVAQSKSGVAVLLGDGLGNFDAGQWLPLVLTAGPTSVSVADIDGDGRKDVVAGTGDVNNTYLGLGDGTFRKPSQFPYYAVSAVVADFNGDGLADVAYSCLNLLFCEFFTDLTVVRFSDGHGGFAGYETYPFLGNGLSTADVNGDGVMDLLAPGKILYGVDGGAFRGPVTFGPIPANAPIAVGDFNGDGRPDIAFGLAGGFEFLLQTPDGGFGVPGGAYDAGAIAGALATLIAADFNGDGHLDLATQGSFGAEQSIVQIFFNSGDGGFIAQPAIDAGYMIPVFGTTAPLSQAVTAVDLNGDGLVDLVIPWAGGFRVRLNDGHGAFPTAHDYDANAPPTATGFIGVADVTGDLAPDVLLALGQTILFFENSGDGTFKGPFAYLYAGATPDKGAFGDINGDGRNDVVVLGQDDLGIGIGTMPSVCTP